MSFQDQIHFMIIVPIISFSINYSNDAPNPILEDLFSFF